jgi:hypothetical protein
MSWQLRSRSHETEGCMGEPIYRWVCTYCQVSDLAESSEMARLAVDAHVSLFHTPASERVRAQPGSVGPILVEPGLPSSDVRKHAREPIHEPPADRSGKGALSRLLHGLLRRPPR